MLSHGGNNRCVAKLVTLAETMECKGGVTGTRSAASKRKRKPWHKCTAMNFLKNDLQEARDKLVKADRRGEIGAMSGLPETGFNGSINLSKPVPMEIRMSMRTPGSIDARP